MGTVQCRYSSVVMVDEALSAVVEERRPRGKIKDGVLNEAVYHTMTALAKPTI